MENRIIKKFIDLKKQNKKGLIIFLTPGIPDIHQTYNLITSAEKNGVDIIEIGVPFSDPIADGPIIQTSSYLALNKGVNIEEIFTLVKRVRNISEIPLILMTYYNPVYKYGRERFFKKAKFCGIDGIIISDILPENSYNILKECKKYNLSLIPLAAPTSTDKRIKLIDSITTSFIYCISRTGTTGEAKNIDKSLFDFINRVRKISNKFLAVGFGISNKNQAKEISKFSDAIIIGSAVVKMTLDKKYDINKILNFIKEIREGLDG